MVNKMIMSPSSLYYNHKISVSFICTNFFLLNPNQFYHSTYELKSQKFYNLKFHNDKQLAQFRLGNYSTGRKIRAKAYRACGKPKRDKLKRFAFHKKHSRQTESETDIRMMTLGTTKSPGAGN
jgi:hypothetical protein